MKCCLTMVHLINKHVYIIKSIKIVLLFIFILLIKTGPCFSQATSTLSGTLTNKSNEPLAYANIILEGTQFMASADESGQFLIKDIPPGNYTLLISLLGYEKFSKKITIKNNEPLLLQLQLKSRISELKAVEIEAEREKVYMEKMPEIRGTDIFAGKKSEIIALDKSDANLAENNTRQVFSKVPGISAWEMDGAGVQVSISSRGLNPHRSW
jgi:Fe(3+) dicitrate transport protein